MMTEYQFSTLIDQLVQEKFRKTSREYENNIIAVNGGTAFDVSALPSTVGGRMINTRQTFRHDSLSNWISSDVYLLEGEPAISYEFDRFDGSKKTYRLKIGKKDPDGTLHKWSELSYLNIDISDVIGLSAYLSASDNTRYRFSSDDNVTLSLFYTIDRLPPYTWHDTGDRFSVSAINDKVTTIYSDYTTSAQVSAIVSAYNPKIDLSAYYKKSETSASWELSLKFNDLSSFSNEWKSSVDISVSNLSSAIKNVDDNKINIVNDVSDYMPKFTATGQLISSNKKANDVIISTDFVNLSIDLSKSQNEINEKIAAVLAKLGVNISY